MVSTEEWDSEPLGTGMFNSVGSCQAVVSNGHAIVRVLVTLQLHLSAVGVFCFHHLGV